MNKQRILKTKNPLNPKIQRIYNLLHHTHTHTHTHIVEPEGKELLG
ncbi:hypothetical protein BH23BAC2_BH23BAC2_09240 [soil metagenome]